MTEEEKEAIEFTRNLIETIKQSNMLFDEDITAKLGIATQNNLQIVLNLMQKQQKELEKLKKNNKDLLRKLKNRVKEVKKLTKYSLYKKEFSRLNVELEKKDKIIDEMAEFITDLKIAHFKKEEGGEFLGKYRCWNKREWRQYFEKSRGE